MVEHEKGDSDNFWRGRRVFVTGATGFLGSHLARRLVRADAQVAVLLRPGSQRIRINELLPQVQVVEGDLTNAESIRTAVESIRPEVIYHLAAAGVTPGISDRTVVAVNVLGTLHLLETSVNCSVTRFIYVGSCFEYGSGSNMFEDHLPMPTNVYAASKLAGHALVQAFGRSRDLPVVSLRPFTPYGPWERITRLVPYTIVNALKHEEIRMTRGEQERDYIYVGDVIEGLLLAGERREAVGQTLNLCSGEAIRIKEIVCEILTILENPVDVYFGAMPYRSGEMFQQSGNNILARTVLGWAPQVSLRQGLEQTIQWYRKNLNMAGQLT